MRAPPPARPDPEVSEGRGPSSSSWRSSFCAEMPAGHPPSKLKSRGERGHDGTDRARPGPVLVLGEVASFEAVVTGARDTTYEASSEAGNIQPFGGCRAERPMRMGFNIEPPGGVESGRFGWVTVDPVGPGVTGSFPFETASFWYPRLGAPSQTTFEGPGTLEITRHDARADARRRSGRLVARGLTDASGASVDVEVAFDLGGSCGIEK